MTDQLHLDWSDSQQVGERYDEEAMASPLLRQKVSRELYLQRNLRKTCPHFSWTGDEGPVASLGRMPRRWKCDGCGAIRVDGR